MQKDSRTAETVHAATPPSRRTVWRALGLGLITGAADDDPCAVGTYASAGAKFGYALLWTAPVTFPMMFAVVYLSSKLGQVSGQGLFQLIRTYYPKWLLYPLLIGVLIGNTIEAGANIGGIAAGLNVLVPIPIVWIVIPISLGILALQIWGSYSLLRNILRLLSFSLLAYVGSAFLSKPELIPVLKASFIPTFRFDREFLSMLVAILGTSLSAYLYTWQSNAEVEEKIQMGKKRLWQRRGTTDRALRMTKIDILVGMIFSNAIMYFIILSTAGTLHKAGMYNIETAAEAAASLKPLAGDAAGALFALGIVTVGLLAVPVMTSGAAYDLCQTFGWQGSLHAKIKSAKKFYLATVVFTLLAMSMNFFGFNPMKALIWSAVIQGFSTPPLMLIIMLMTNNKKIVGKRTNHWGMNLFGGITTIAMFAATACLVVTWFWE